MKIRARFFVHFSLLLTLFVTFSVTQAALAAEVRISAAASLTDVVKELIAGYRQSHQEVKLLPNFASSGALANQIAAGAPADIYISANPKWMDYLQQQGLIGAGAEQILVHNSLVFVGAPNSGVTSLQGLPGLQRIAIASPKSAPAGKYAEQALTAAGLYPQLLDKSKLVLAKDVRQALLYADRGEVDGAIVYRTDALLARQAKILFAVPQTLYPQVEYPVALTRSGAGKKAAQPFLDYLLGDDARQVFKKYGFVTR